MNEPIPIYTDSVCSLPDSDRQQESQVRGGWRSGEQDGQDQAGTRFGFLPACILLRRFAWEGEHNPERCYGIKKVPNNYDSDHLIYSWFMSIIRTSSPRGRPKLRSYRKAYGPTGKSLSPPFCFFFKDFKRKATRSNQAQITPNYTHETRTIVGGNLGTQNRIRLHRLHKCKRSQHWIAENDIGTAMTPENSCFQSKIRDRKHSQSAAPVTKFMQGWETRKSKSRWYSHK